MMRRFGPVRAAIVTVLLMLVVAAYLRNQALKSTHASTIKPSTIGTPDYGEKTPGNPEATIAQAKKAYRAILHYRKRHNGDFPDTTQLRADMMDPAAGYSISVKDLESPDCKYSDIAGQRMTSPCWHLIVEDKRPDGTSLREPKERGKRDVLARSDLYYHRNVQHGNKTMSFSPTGFFIVLWDDGEVEKVPYHRGVWAPLGGGRSRLAIDTQAGLPPGTRTYDEQFKNVPRH